MIELKIEVSSPEALRDTLSAFALVLSSGLVRPTDRVTMNATDGVPTEAGIEAFVDAAPDPEPEPAPIAEAKPRRRSRQKAAATPEPFPEPDPDPETVEPETEPEPEAEPEPEPEPEPVPESERLVPRTSKANGKTEEIVLTADDVRAAVKRTMDSKGVPEAIARLRRVGFKSVSDVPPEHYRTAINSLLQDD